MESCSSENVLFYSFAAACDFNCTEQRSWAAIWGVDRVVLFPPSDPIFQKSSPLLLTISPILFIPLSSQSALFFFFPADVYQTLVEACLTAARRKSDTSGQHLAQQ